MIEDFIEGLKKKFKIEGTSTGDKEIHEFVNNIYNRLKGGEIRNCVQVFAFKFIKSIKPEISKGEMMKGIMVIESIVETVFCMMVEEGVLTKMESKDGDKIVMHWEGERV